MPSITRVCVYGLWHTGSVVAASLAEHFVTIGCDPDAAVVSRLRAAGPPVAEPGLADLIQKGLSSKKLSFSSDLKSALDGVDVVWVTFDTPVNENDEADVDFVKKQTQSLFPYLSDGVLVLVSSQVPVGFTAELKKDFRTVYPKREVSFCYSPENLRLGQALDAFCKSERIVVGINSETDRERLSPLFAPFCQRLEWMSVPSAEMTKHALNAFLATSVVFANEIAVLCEKVGADAKEVERGLKSDGRIGPKAYLNPGGAFAGGTLARDVNFLRALEQKHNLSSYLPEAVIAGNQDHKLWPRRKLEEVLGAVPGKTVAVLGLTYKPNTSTLRRSSALEFCLWLGQQGAKVQAYDPGIKELLTELSSGISLCGSMAQALEGADVLFLATPWPVFKTLSTDDLLRKMRKPIVVDPDRFLEWTLAGDSRITYVTIGKSIQNK